MQSWVITAGWGPRHEAYLDCRNRLRLHLGGLSSLGDPFRCWYKQGNEPLGRRPVEVDSNTALDLLLESAIQYKDDAQSPCPELGYSITLWNGDISRCSVTTSIIVSSTSKFCNNNVNVVISSHDTSYVLPEGVVISAFRHVISSWSPEFGSVVVSQFTGEDFLDREIAKFLRKRDGQRATNQYEEFSNGVLWMHNTDGTV